MVGRRPNSLFETGGRSVQLTFDLIKLQKPSSESLCSADRSREYPALTERIK